MTKHISKKLDLATICKNTLLVCSAITALGGAVGGLKEQFMGNENEAAAPTPTTIIIEQRTVGGERHISKTVRVQTGGQPAEEAPQMPADTVTAMAPAPESSLTDWKLPWGWMMSIGIAIIGSIIVWEKWTRRNVTIQTKETP